MTNSAWHERELFQISSSLVIILGIGEYDGMPNLIGVTKDYKNIIYTFYKQFGYSVAFYDSKNTLHYCNKKPNTDIQQTKLQTKDFKIKWCYDEIKEYVTKINQIVAKNNHDSLLFFISSHGEQDGVILDSDCEDVQLMSIFDQFFGGKCPTMLCKPKLFFVDACRGPMTSRIKVKLNPSTQSNTPDPKIPKASQKYESGLPTIAELTNSGVKSGHTVSGSGVRGRTDSANKSTSKHSQKKRNTSLKNLFHNEANCRFIYANPDGYAAMDGGANGGYLIQATKYVFNKIDDIEKKNLDNIVNQIRLKTRVLVGKGSMENVQDVNHMNFDVYFQKATNI